MLDLCIERLWGSVLWESGGSFYMILRQQVAGENVSTAMIRCHEVVLGWSSMIIDHCQSSNLPLNLRPDSCRTEDQLTRNT